MKQEVKHPDQLLLEEELIKKAQADPALFKPLYEAYYKQIFLFILHRIGEKELTADVASQVFLKALLNIGRFRFKGLPFSALVPSGLLLMGKVKANRSRRITPKKEKRRTAGWN